jgi:quinol monooxygenase YgiN
MAMIELAAGLFVAMIEIAVIPEKREEFIALTAEQVPAARAFEGNLQFDVLVDPKRPNIVVYLERWESEDDNKKFFAWWVAKGMTEKLRPLVTAAPKETTYTQAID